jgi:hypothetical protein
MFDNLTCDAIVDSYGGQSDSQGRVDGVYIYNSTFSNCNIHGIVKARQASYCIVSNCSYDFPVSNDIPLVGPFYINCTDRPVIKTNLDIVVNGNSLVISLTDELGKPLKDVEIEIVTNGRVSYQYTDNEGKIVLSNLLGTYSFEISYPGDEYEGYAPASAVKNLTFKNNDSGNVTEDKNSSSKPATNNPSSSIKTTKVATKITAKKATFKAKKKTKKYTIALKADGKAVPKVKVTLKIKGKTYKAKTNAKGKATFKITKLNKKGKYKATIKFAGNSNYKAATKKVKITVKK